MSRKRCFLLAPIGPDGSEVRRQSDLMLRHVIRPAAAEAGYDLHRADEIASPGVITSQIARDILEADLVIADLTGRNPNVMYELGVRHAVGKPVIQLIAKGETLPFDVAAMRTLVIDSADLDSVSEARATLALMITSVEAESAAYESPVSAALQIRSYEQRRATEPQEHELPLVNVLKEMENRLKTLEHSLRKRESPSAQPKEFSRRVFVVHGHDGEMKNELARLLEKLEFDPVILHEQPDQGQTIFAKLNGELSDVGFAFIILTPDDIGAIATKEDELQARARQNVVFEHGLFAGYLSPERVCAIRKGNVEVPSDLHGVLYKTVPESGGIQTIALEIVNELRAAGYLVDANRLLSAR